MKTFLCYRFVRLNSDEVVTGIFDGLFDGPLVRLLFTFEGSKILHMACLQLLCSGLGLPYGLLNVGLAHGAHHAADIHFRLIHSFLLIGNPGRFDRGLYTYFLRPTG